MSKKIFFVLGLVSIISMSSCRKNRTCRCVTTIVSSSDTKETQKDIIINDVNKTEGEEDCARNNSEMTFPGFKETISCTLVD